MKDMTEKEQLNFVVDGFKRKATHTTLKSRFTGMTKKQIENWAKATIAIHVRQWKIRTMERKEIEKKL